jgi:D-3-phosphoglycerate dehydrogenase
VVSDAAHLPTADIILIRSETKADRPWIDRAKNLKLLIRGGVRTENVDTDHCTRKGILFRTTPEASAVAVAELVFALMLAAARHIVEAHLATRSGQWPKKELRGSELYGKTLGLVGVGRIGTEVAKRAEAFGMTVLAVRRTGKSHDIAELVDFDTLLARSDFISLHVPLNNTTRELINKRTLAKMKDGVMLVNTASGGCVNEPDLAQALNSGKVACAGLDVFAKEPPVGSPLLTAKNVLLTPHVGSPTAESNRRIGTIVSDLIRKFAAGELK